MVTLYIILNTILITAIVIYVTYFIKQYKASIAKKKEKEEKKRSYIKYFINQISKAENLYDLYILHIQMWGCGIRCANFGPNKYGMFRTENILTMKPEEVYLGNIWGLFTKPLPFWNTCSKSDQELVLNQYKNILLSNLKEIEKNSYEKV